MSWTGRIVLLGALGGGAALAKGPAAKGPADSQPISKRAPTVDERIGFHEKQVAARANLYPAFVELAAAYLDKASVTHDPSWLAKARSAVDRSLAIQDNHEAFLLKVRLANHTHRFADALTWGRRASASSVNGALVPDATLVPALLEAHMGLGQVEEAKRVLPSRSQAAQSHHSAVARGHFLAAHKQTNEAVAAFQQAALLAKTDPALSAWCEVRAAGALIDAGRAKEAQPLLRHARKLDPGSRFLRMHEAEVAEAQEQPAAALLIYEEIVRQEPSPDLHAQAYVLARKLGQEARAQVHFAAAERGYRRAIDAGEVHTLGGLADLYLTADVKLPEALAFAERNLSYKRDAQAHATVAKLRAKLSQTLGPTAGPRRPAQARAPRSP